MNLLELLQIETGASEETLRRIIRTAPKRYKVYPIAKRNGKGVRIIAHPAKELKILQRIILRQILDPLPVSELAMAYIPGRGILRNAQMHVGQRWLLKLDFRDFFHSITPPDWDRIVRRTDDLQKWKSDRALLHRLLFWGAGASEPTYLSIGAPTSPSISNLACFRLDQWMSRNAHERGLKITRYADDITVSGSNVPELRKFERDLGSVLKRSKGLQLVLNENKRGLYGPGEKKLVTGLLLTPDGKVSIGRERKRELHALIHKCKIGVTEDGLKMRAKGMLAFAKMAEEPFFRTLVDKYGRKTIKEVMRFSPEIDDLVVYD